MFIVSNIDDVVIENKIMVVFVDVIIEGESFGVNMKFINFDVIFIISFICNSDVEIFVYNLIKIISVVNIYILKSGDGVVILFVSLKLNDISIIIVIYILEEDF